MKFTIISTIAVASLVVAESNTTGSTASGSTAVSAFDPLFTEPPPTTTLNYASVAAVLSTALAEEITAWDQLGALYSDEPFYPTLTSALENLETNAAAFSADVMSIATDPARLSTLIALMPSLEAEVSSLGPLISSLESSAGAAPTPTVAPLIKAGGALAVVGMAAVALL